MSAVIEAVVAITVVVLVVATPIVSAILATMSSDFEQFVSDQFEIVLGWFGIEDEDVVTVNVHDQLLFTEDDNVQEMLTQLAITHSKTDQGIMELLASSSNRIRGAYTSFFNNGDTEYSSGLPETNLRASVVPDAELIDIINAKYNVTATAINTSKKVPTKEEFVYATLFDIYNYSASLNEMSYNNLLYNVTSINYNYGTNNYDVTIGREMTERTTTTVVVTSLNESTTTTVTTTTTITVTNVNATTDNVNTVVTERTLVVGTVSGTLSDDTVLVSDTDEIVPIGSVTNSVTEDITNSNGTNHYADNVATTILIEEITAESTVITSNTTTNAQVAVGTVNDSVTVVEVDYTDHDEVTLYYIAPLPVHHYVVEFVTNGSDNTYWVYEIGSGLYPDIDDQNTYITNLEMLPVVPIRNNSVSITSDKTSASYLETKEILNTIGLDPDTLVEAIEESPDIDNVESSHVHFGVDPRVEDPIIAKALFETFDYIYADSALYSTEASSYLATMQEGVYNASLMWKEFEHEVVAGSIGTLGVCTNEVTTKTITDSSGASEVVDVLVLRKQTAPEFYTEYRITYLTSSTFISNGAFHSTTTGTLKAGSLIVPISKFFIDKLTGLEQMELFSKSLRLSVYAIDVQHLRYYETASFASFIKIVMYVIAIVIFVFTWYTGGATVAAFWAAVQSLLVSYAVSYAFIKLLESTDNAALQAIYTALAVAAMVYTGQVEGVANTTFLSANMLTQAVQVHTQQGYEKLEEQSSVFQQGLAERRKEFEEAEAIQNAGLGTDVVTGLVSMEPNKGYIEGIDSFMFRAKGQVQYQYQALFDYDKPFDIYDNAFRLDLNKPLS